MGHMMRGRGGTEKSLSPDVLFGYLHIHGFTPRDAPSAHGARPFADPAFAAEGAWMGDGGAAPECFTRRFRASLTNAASAWCD